MLFIRVDAILKEVKHKPNGDKSMPLSQLTLDGIERFGSKWRVTISLSVPKDIPSLFAKIETNYEAIELGHNIASRLVKKLKYCRNILPKDSLDELDEIIEQFETSIIYEDINALKSWSVEYLEEFACHVQEELLGQLNELYDWAGYYRILFNTK